MVHTCIGRKAGHNYTRHAQSTQSCWHVGHECMFPEWLDFVAIVICPASSWWSASSRSSVRNPPDGSMGRGSLLKSATFVRLLLAWRQQMQLRCSPERQSAIHHYAEAQKSASHHVDPAIWTRTLILHNSGFLHGSKMSPELCPFFIFTRSFSTFSIFHSSSLAPTTLKAWIKMGCSMNHQKE